MNIYTCTATVKLPFQGEMTAKHHFGTHLNRLDLRTLPEDQSINWCFDIHG